MYSILVLLHSYNRWLILLAMGWALFQLGRGMVQRRDWQPSDTWAVNALLVSVRLQFILGIILFFIPVGFAQAAWRSIDTAMVVRDLRFFGLEHPLQMIIAVALIETGAARSKRAAERVAKYRWALISFAIALLLILAAIPWWRPLLRTL